MSFWEPEGLYGLYRVLVQSARKDKELMKRDLTQPLGADYASFIPHVDVNPEDFRVALMFSQISVETTLLSLKGVPVKIAIPPETRAIMAELALTEKEYSLQIPARERAILIDTLRKVSHGREEEEL